MELYYCFFPFLETLFCFIFDLSFLLSVFTLSILSYLIYTVGSMQNSKVFCILIILSSASEKVLMSWLELLATENPFISLKFFFLGSASPGSLTIYVWV